MYEIKRTQAEIDEQLNLAADQEMEGRSKFPSMKYEEGVSAAIRWLIGDENDAPMDD